MFKRLTAICLLAALISSNFSCFIVYIGFSANQKYIAENICINKSRPWLHCNGHCYFMKKMRQADEKEKNEEKQNQKNLLQESSFERFPGIEFHTFLLRKINTPYQAQAPSILHKAIFHPPQFS